MKIKFLESEFLESSNVQIIPSNLVSAEGLAPVVVNVEFHPLLIQRQQSGIREALISLKTDINITFKQLVFYSVLYLDNPQVFVVFADHFQLVFETVGHDHVSDIVHQQRVETTEHQIPFFSKIASGIIFYDKHTIETAIWRVQ